VVMISTSRIPEVPIVADNEIMPKLHSFRERLRLRALAETVLGLQLVREWVGPRVRGCRRLRDWFRLLGLTAQGGVPWAPLRGHRMGCLRNCADRVAAAHQMWWVAGLTAQTARSATRS
jgi:hypothetical protein